MTNSDQSPLQLFSSQLTEAVASAAGAVVSIRGGRTVASGLLWRDGIVVSADEALDDLDAFDLKLPDGSSASAHLIGRDPSSDVAVLKAEGGLTPSWRPADTPPTGAIALVVGRGGSGSLAAFGIVSASGGEWTSALGGQIDAEIRLSFQLSKPLEGGAVIAADGSLVGLAAAGPRRQGLAIPVSTVERAMAILLDKGYVPRAFLGVGLHDFSGRDGVLVTETNTGSPADQAGLMVGDIITTWDGEPICNAQDVWRRLGFDAVGKTAVLDVIRAGHPVEVRVSVGERKPRSC